MSIAFTRESSYAALWRVFFSWGSELRTHKHTISNVVGTVASVVACLEWPMLVIASCTLRARIVNYGVLCRFFVPLNLVSVGVCIGWLHGFLFGQHQKIRLHNAYTHTHICTCIFLWLVTSEFNVCTRKPVLAAKQRSEETRRFAGALNFKCSCTTVMVVQWGNSTAVMSSRRTKFSAPSKYCLVWTVSVRRRLTMHIYLYVQTCIFWVINVLPLARLSSYFPIIPPHLSFWAHGARGCLGRSCHIYPVRRFLHHISQHWRWHTGYIRLWRMLCFGGLGWSCHSAHDRKSSRGAYETLPLCWNADPRHSSRSAAFANKAKVSVDKCSRQYSDMAKAVTSARLVIIEKKATNMVR